MKKRLGRGTAAAPHPNSIAANLHKLTPELREKYDRNRRIAVDDALAMEAWAKKTMGRSRRVEGGSQDPLANEGLPASRRKHRGAMRSGDRSQREAE